MPDSFYCRIFVPNNKQMYYTPETYATLTIDQKRTIEIDSAIDYLIDMMGDYPNNIEILEHIWNEEEDTLGITMENIKNHVR